MKRLIDKWCRLPESVKSTITFVVSSFILKGITFITTPIFTRVMNSSQYGILSTFNSWLVIIEVFALLGLTSAGVFNVGLNDYKESRDSYISSLLCLCNLFTLITFGLLFVINAFVDGKVLLPTNQLVLMFLWFIFSPAQVFWITRKRYEYKYKLAFLVSVISSIASQSISLIFVTNCSGENLAEIKLWSQYAVAILFVLPIYFFLLVKGKTFYNRSYWKQTILFALPLIPHYLAQHVMSGADRIMLSEMVSSSSVAIYSVVNNIGIISSILWNSVNASLIAYTFENLNKKQYGGVSCTVTLLLAYYAIVCVFVAMVAPEIMRILAPEEYYTGIYAIPPIMCVAFLSALYNVYANIEFYHKKSSCIAMSTIIATLTNILLNIVLIPRFTFVGAAYTTLISYIVLIIMHYIGYRKCNEPVYENRNIATVAFVGVVACLLCNLLYINNVIRYVVLCCILIALIWKRKYIFEVMKSIRR